jgi:hypothetical protein
MSLVDDIAGDIAAMAAPFAVTKDIMPDAPHRVIAVFQSSGRVPDPKKSLGLDYPALQLRVRGNPHDSAEAAAKAEELHDHLHDRSGLIGSSTYISIEADHSPALFRIDENGRPEYSLNFRTAREREAA